MMELEPVEVHHFNLLGAGEEGRGGSGRSLLTYVVFENTGLHKQHKI